MKLRYLPTLSLCLLAILSYVVGQEIPSVKPIPAAKERPAWDQEEAMRRTNAVLALEKSGQRPWDDLAWEVDPILAADRAAREQKPIFVFFYLRKPTGPADAPC